MRANSYGGEVTFLDLHAANYSTHNAIINRKWFTPLKKDETSRTCLICGSEYRPKGRTQKYCGKDCARQAAYRKRNADGLKCH